jgi:hypothetical protein
MLIADSHSCASNARNAGLLWLLLASAQGCVERSKPVLHDAGSDAGTNTAAASADADVEAADLPDLQRGPARWFAVPTGQNYQDRPLADWVLDWTHWYMSANSCETAETDLDGSGCTLFQRPTSQVFFLARGKYVTVRTQCRMSRNMGVLVPISFYIAGLAPSPFDEITSLSDLEQEAREISATMRDMVLQVDGVDLLDLEDYRVDPLMFMDVIPAEPNRLTCEGNEGVSGSVGPFFIAGYFALLPAAPVGRHVITYGGTYSRNGIDVVDRVRATISIE